MQKTYTVNENAVHSLESKTHRSRDTQ